MTKHIVFLLIFLTLAQQKLSAQTRLHLKSGEVMLENNIGELAAYPEASAFNQKYFVVLCFNSIPTSTQVKELNASGVQLLDYLPHLAYWASVNSATPLSKLNQLGVTGLHTLPANHKYHRILTEQPIPYWTVNGSRIKAILEYFSSAETDLVIEELKKAGVVITENRPHVYQLDIEFNTELLDTIAGLPFVNFIDHATPPITPDNVPGVNNHRANVLTSAIAGRNLSGNGVAVGVGDGGFVTPHLDFQNRMTNFASSVLSGWGDHGDHVAGTIGGAGIINRNYLGMAPRATLYAHQASNFVSNTAFYFNTYGIVLTNNSYGFVTTCSGFGQYTSVSRSLDMQLITSNAVNHVFAAANDGGTSCSPYPAGFATMSQGYGSSKNVLTVGAVSDLDALASFSSRGPCDDGRIKPDICGVGTSVISTIPTNTYGSKNGTSMATPGVTGTLALIYERFRSLNSGSNPDGALIKALVMNTADDIGNAGPDFRHGYGRLNAKRAVEALEAGTFTFKNVSQNDSITHTITIPAGAIQLRVLVYWKDKEANANANPALVNNIDMHVINPSLTLVRPWVLDTTPVLVNTTAIQGIDNLNNTEQVTINNPAAGNYVVSLLGKSIPFGPQKCFIVWEVVMPTLALTFPTGGEKFSPGSSQRLRFDAYGLTTGNFILEYSLNNGSSWTTISNTININNRFFDWLVPSAISSNCRVRLRHSTATTLRDSSLTFTIIGTPSISSSSVSSCGNQVLLRWNGITGATTYDVMQLNGTVWTQVANTNKLYHTITNLAAGKSYWFSLRANGSSGEQSAIDTGISVTVSSSGCTYTSIDGGVSAIVSPTGARTNTSGAFTSTTAVTIQVKNYGTSAIGNFPVYYQVNGGSIVSEVFSLTLLPNSTGNHTFSATSNLSGTGMYSIKAWTGVPADTLTSNNAFTSDVVHLNNSPIALPYSQGFEGVPDTVTSASFFGLTGAQECDYSGNDAQCRLRTKGGMNLTRTGNRAIFLDKAIHTATASTNYLTVTLNMSSYTTTNNIVLSFAYLQTGEERNTNDSVWIRGNDAAPWLPIYDLWGNRAANGTYKTVSNINLSQTLATAGQNYSSSFQLRFGQEDNSTQRTANDSDGVVFDDILIEDLSYDAQVVSSAAPATGCGLGSAADVSVVIKNNGLLPISNFPVSYRINGGSIVTETFTGSLGAGNSTTYVFSTKANLSTPGNYTISIWTALTADGKRNNDTLTKSVTSIELISTFPYNQSFESSNGNFFTGGTNSSWAWGTPAGNLIDTAANGSKAWVTSLNGDYNDNELSYLYSPCFNLSTLTTAVVSFNMIFQTETNYDRVWMEYSENGTTWVKLGTAGSGTNWYTTGGSTQAWEGTSATWRVRSFTIPLASILNKTNVRFRMVLSTDGNTTFEGVGFDDFLIIGTPNSIYTGSNVVVSAPSTGSGWIDFNSVGQRVLSINDNGQNLGLITVQTGISGLNRVHNNQQLLRRNWAIKPTNNPTGTYTVRLFFLNTEYTQLDAADDSVSSIHDLAVSKYNGTNEDTIITNNSGTYSLIPPSAIRKVPFNNGYYLEFTVTGFSEFWVHAGGPNNNIPLPVEWLDFTAEKVGNNALLNWSTVTEKNNDYFTVELQADNKNEFTELENIRGAGNSNRIHHYSYTDTEDNKTGLRYYRIRQTDFNGSFSYSPVRVLNFSDASPATVTLKPNPTRGTVYMELAHVTAGEVTVFITDYTGRTVATERVQAPAGGQGSIAVSSTSALQPGIYLLKVEINGHTHHLKLVKQ